MTKTTGNYGAKDITFWESDLDKIRARPQMYIGSTDGATGIFSIVREVLDNGVDEFQAGHAKVLDIVVADDYATYTIKDDGRGIPVAMHPVAKKPTLTVVLSYLQTSGKINAGKGKAYENSIGTHGVGAKATNALSDKFTAITCNNGKWFKTEFAKGKEKLKPTACKAPTGMRKGTLISFSPDVSVFKKHANTVPQISAWADLTSRLNPGIRIRLTHKGKTKEWFEPGGIKSLVESRAVKLEAVPIGKLFEYHSSHMDLALSFTNAEGDLIDAYTNTVKNAEGGVHLNALRSALYDVLKAYLRKGEKMTPHDLLEGVIGVLNYKIAAPRFDSQTKEKLVDERVGDACRTECIEALQAFFDKNKKMADQIVLQAVQLREATNEFRKNKELTRKLKVAKKSKILLPDKLTASLKCAPDKRELYAVEGDSAAGTAKQARFNDFQEVFALRGKFMNAMRSTANQLFASDEVIGILQAIGYNPDVKDPMAHLRIGKLLWLADADADGAHINALGLTLLYKILPEMFDEGMVYVVVGSEFVGKTDDGKLLYADSLNELKALNGGKLPKNAKQLKGWGAATPTDLREMAFDPKTRRLLKVMPPKDGGDEFALLMEDNVEYRRKLLGV